jgi:hypothetical protein
MVYPLNLLDETDRMVLGLWRHYRSSGMGGRGHLPFGGGIADQPAFVLACFEAMDSAESLVRSRQDQERESRSPRE